MEKIVQKWEGVVQEINDDEIIARLYDLINVNNFEEEIIFSKDKVLSTDRDLIRPGALFYLTIYAKGKSVIKFKKFPKWGKKEFNNSEKESEELLNSLNIKNYNQE